MTTTNPSGLDFLYGRINYERAGLPSGTDEMNLERTRRLLGKLGDPQRRLSCIHIAGTKGKGSIAALLASALSATGRKVGLFTSPHLHRIEERFRIDGVPIPNSDFLDLIEEIRPAVLESDAEDPPGPSFFEITTALGLLYFARRGVDLAVIEVGVGGRLDSTNVIDPLVSVITSISFDHTKTLGDTLGAIAREKAGIIKPGRPVVSGVEGAEAVDVIREVAREHGAPLREVGRDFLYAFQPPAEPRTPSAGAARVRTWRGDWGMVPLPLLGPHQAHNLAVALATLDVLADLGLPIPAGLALEGIARTTMPARVEIFGSDPWVVIDGAHNVASAEALAETLRFCFPPGPRTLIFGTTRDKDLPGQLRALLPHFDRVVATRYVTNPRAVPVGQAVSEIEEIGGVVPLRAESPAEALELARTITPGGGVIVVTGSLFLAAEARECLLGPDA